MFKSKIDSVLNFSIKSTLVIVPKNVNNSFSSSVSLSSFSLSLSNSIKKLSIKLRLSFKLSVAVLKVVAFRVEQSRQ